MGVAYCIIKGKARLGRKNCSALALTNVNSNHKAKLSKLLQIVKSNFNVRYEQMRRHWGVGVIGSKSLLRISKLKSGT
ncbi:maker611 [Drosophila busckii]|uniref:60S ribosomal protein L7a n=1 Tax=Drosophila busckii TaxID=30019 RepID=A0A0M4EAG8_DROBS|nr:maker611 [Drosophila busckii]